MAAASSSMIGTACASNSNACRESCAAASMRSARSANVSLSIIVVLKLVGNLDLFRSAAPKDLNNEGQPAEPRLPEWKEERSGATSGEVGECFAVNKNAASAVHNERGRERPPYRFNSAIAPAPVADAIHGGADNCVKKFEVTSRARCSLAFERTRA